MISGDWALWAPMTGTTMRRMDRLRMWRKQWRISSSPPGCDDEINHIWTAVLRSLRIRGCHRAATGSGTVSLKPYWWLLNSGHKLMWGECHLTALDVKLIVMILLNTYNHIIADFECSEGLIREKYLYLSNIWNNDGQHTYVVAVELPPKVRHLISMSSTGMYVCALAWTMPVDAEAVVRQGGNGHGPRLF